MGYSDKEKYILVFLRDIARLEYKYKRRDIPNNGLCTPHKTEIGIPPTVKNEYELLCEEGYRGGEKGNQKGSN